MLSPADRRIGQRERNIAAVDRAARRLPRHLRIRRHRRQAEALVNEEFGVYSRKAVIRENLAAYDAAIEEAYKCMKEGDGNLA